jgi:hypothetical protein
MTTLTPTDLDQFTKAGLKNLVKRGIVRVSMDITLTELETMTKDELPEYQKHTKLIGKSISISEAARKYKIPNGTVVRWVQRGIIRRLGTEKNRVLIDEADVAYCAEIRSQNPGAGRWLFNIDGTPYTPKG